MTFSHISCPNCEFRSGTAGSPSFLPDGRLSCAVCKSVWRDMGTPRTSKANTLTILPSPQQQTIEGTVRHDEGLLGEYQYSSAQRLNRKTALNHNFGQRPVQDIASQNNSGSLSYAAFGVMALVFVLGGGFVANSVIQNGGLGIDQTIVASIGNSALAVENVHLETRVTGGDTAAWVTGEITNLSSTTKTLPNYDVIMLGDNQQEIYRWRYQINAKRLKPNGRIKFSTSMAGIPAKARSVKLQPVGEVKN